MLVEMSVDISVEGCRLSIGRYVNRQLTDNIMLVDMLTDISV